MLIPPQVHTEKLMIQRDTTDGSPAEFPVYMAKPNDEPAVKRPVLILIQEAFGVNEHIQNVCRRYARQGYVVVSPDMYYRTGHWQTFNYGDFQATMGARAPLTEERVVGDLRAVLDFITTLDGVDSTQIGVLGYCMGGRFSYITACHFSDRIKAAAIYYGGFLNQESAEFPVAPIKKANQIKVPVIGFFGGEDKGIPRNVVEELDQALEAAKVQHEIYFYPQADHGFFCNDRPSYNPEAAQDAWHRTLEFFKQNLRAAPSVNWSE